MIASIGPESLARERRSVCAEGTRSTRRLSHVLPREYQAGTAASVARPWFFEAAFTRTSRSQAIWVFRVRCMRSEWLATAGCPAFLAGVLRFWQAIG